MDVLTFNASFAYAVLFIVGIQPTEPRVALAGSETAAIETYAKAAFAARGFELSGSFYLSRRERSKALEVARTHFGENDWRCVEQQLWLQFLERVESLPDDDFRRVLRMQAAKRRMISEETRGNSTAAIKAGAEAIRISKDLFGEKSIHHIELLTVKAHCHNSVGDVRTEIDIIQRSIDYSQGVAGEQHPLVLEKKIGLARAISGSPRWREAEPMMRDQIRSMESLFADHPSDPVLSRMYFRTCYDLANFCIDIQRLDEAESLLVKSKELSNGDSRLARHNQVVATGMQAWLQLSKKCPRKAATLAAHAAELARKHFGASGINYAHATVLLATAKAEQGDVQGAERLLERVEHLLPVQSGGRHRWAIARAQVFLLTGNPERAAELFDEALPMREKRGIHHPSLVSFYRGYANAKRAVGATEEALEFEQRIELIDAQVAAYNKVRGD